MIATGVIVVFYVLTGDLLMSAGALVLMLIWLTLPRYDGPPVLALALSFQWLQVFIGLIYWYLTGREVEPMLNCDWAPMMWIGTGCLLALWGGLLIGVRFLPVSDHGESALETLYHPTGRLLAFYVGVTALGGVLQTFAWSIPQLTQAILALGFGRLVIFYLLLRRATFPRFNLTMLGGLLLLEVIVGFTGYFASFREGLVLTFLVLLQRFDWRRASHWATSGAVLALALVAGLVWTGIKIDVRRAYNERSDLKSVDSRLALVGSHVSDWSDDGSGHYRDADRMVDRLWQIYYPALTLDRVPALLPHTEGVLLQRAVTHILKPRVFYPNKPIMPSDSEMVREYAGVWVAGRERGVTMAFGYSPEMYIDFGVPLMFAPIFAFGLIMGMIYRWLMTTIRVRELAVATTTVIFWLSLYLFERSTLSTLGLAGTLIIFLGGGVVLIDRWFDSARTGEDSTIRGPVSQ